MAGMNCIGLSVIGVVLSLYGAATVAEVVAVVSSRSSVTGLSKNQVMDIFLGRASRLPDGEQVVPIDQAEGSAVRDEFYAKFAGKSPAQVKAHWAKIIFTGRGHPADEVANSNEVKKFVGKNPLAIGYIEKGMVDGSVRVLLQD